MKKLFGLVLCAFLIGAAGCGIASDPAKMATDLILKQKDELIAKLDKSLPGAEKVIKAIEEKIAKVTGDQKLDLQKLLTKLQDLYKKVSDGLAAIKKSGTEGVKDKLADLTKDSTELSKTVQEAEEALKK